MPRLFGTRFRRFQPVDEVVLDAGPLRGGRARIDERAFDARGLAVFLKFHSEIRGVRRVLLVLAESGRRAVVQIDGWIVRGHERVG
jgi:hypothetical protein